MKFIIKIDVTSSNDTNTNALGDCGMTFWSITRTIKKCSPYNGMYKNYIQ